jgi:hypothetical protein
MDSEKRSILPDLRTALTLDGFWSHQLSAQNQSSFTLHLAVLREPYLTFIMQGKKTVETRFAKRPCPPYQRTSKGDVVILKRSPGGIVGICLVEEVWFYRLSVDSLRIIKELFGSAICPAEESFWDDRKQAAVATLLLVNRVTPIDNMRIKKRDRRGWVVFKDSDPRQACPI